MCRIAMVGLTIEAIHDLFPGGAICSPTAPMPGKNSAMRWPSLVTGRLKSSTVSLKRAAAKALPRRWVIEYTFVWLDRDRRLAKKFKSLARL
jgi:hypothetical protein